jgi:hypothetical protein
MKEPIILFRPDYHSEKELAIAKKYFRVVTHRTECKDSVVIGRYSVLPYYRELQEDMWLNGCALINSYLQHNWIANFEYYEDLKEFTPESWYSLSDTDYNGPFVVKGITNSRKYQWNTHMYAADRNAAMRVASELYNDGLIGAQELVYRKYVPLRTFEIGINGTPFTNEWRFFCYKNTILGQGYYWSSADKPELGYLTTSALELVNKITEIAAQQCNFYVLDIAETVEGKWILIEINDGQMSGLSEVNPDILYRNMKAHIQWV